MAQTFFPKLPNLFLLILALAVIIFVAHAKQFKETKMSMYLQDISAGPNATVIPVTGIAGKLWTSPSSAPSSSRTTPSPETPDSNSAPIGRLQGIYVTSGLNGLNSHVSVSIVFTNKVYNGITLELQGNSKQFEGVREASVVFGTGKFRFARGYATFETYFLDLPNAYSVIRCNVTVLH